MHEAYSRLGRILKSSQSLVFFGGAGISTASGIPDFRSSDGLYSKKLNRRFTPEQTLSHSFFLKYPEEFFDFYKKHLIYPKARPNDCHMVLAELEKIGKLSAIVTQNIDGLHQMAGSQKVYELHGSVHRNYCTCCHAFYDADYILKFEGIPHCEHCQGIVKPDVVLYEEGLDEQIISDSVHAIANADTIIIGGTSLIVYPAAGLIRYFKGDNLVLINKTPTPADKNADLVINEDIALVMREAFTIMKAL